MFRRQCPTPADRLHNKNAAAPSFAFSAKGGNHCRLRNVLGDSTGVEQGLGPCIKNPQADVALAPEVLPITPDNENAHPAVN